MINSISSQIWDKLLIELEKKDLQKKIEIKLLDPVIHYVMEKLQPYIISLSLLFILTFLLSLFVFILLITKNI
jgi:hypothetical protein